MAQFPLQTVVMLRKQMKPASVPTEARLAQLIIDLDSESYDTRQQAQVELAKLGALAEAKLRQTLASNPSAEVQCQAEVLLNKLDGPLTLPQVRELRAVELLERLGTCEARALLTELAEGTAKTPLRQEARASCDRLGWRCGSP